jgi:hypothetical protein
MGNVRRFEMSVEVMKQALDVLIEINKLSIGEDAVVALPGEIDGAMDNLRAAIEQAEQYQRNNPLGGPAKVFDAMADAIRAGDDYHATLRSFGFVERTKGYDQTSLELCEECGWKAVIPGDGCLVCARQNAKPVAWMYDFLSDNRDEVIRNWVTQSQDDITRENGFNVRPLYTEPRQWVELTDDEARALVNRATFGDRTNWQALVYMVDAKLKEKNT